jgi:hypothetical protein
MKTIIRALRRRRARLRFALPLWRELIAELARRGRGEVEAGAFLLTPRDDDGRTITRVVYFDDLDPDVLVGHIHLHGSAYPKLSDICEQERLRVVADIHTHPNAWVGQSGTDKDNPMVSRRGHLALIVPRLALREPHPRELGVHEYHGDEGWREHLGGAAARLVYIGRWA